MVLLKVDRETVIQDPICLFKERCRYGNKKVAVNRSNLRQVLRKMPILNKIRNKILSCRTNFVFCELHQMSPFAEHL